MIGLGSWGQRIAARLDKLPQFQWVGLCDRSFKDLDRFSRDLGATPFRSSKTLLDFYLPDLFLISTPVESHFELLKEGLHRGCHVWVTKPVLLQRWQLDEVIQLASEKNQQLFFDHTYIFSSRFQAICDFLPLLSPIARIEAKRGHWGGWQKGSSALEELIYHDIYMSLSWARELPIGVSFKLLDEKNENERTEQLTLHFNSGLVAVLQASFGWKDRQRKVLLSGSDWKLDWDDDALDQPIRLKKPGFEEGAIQVSRSALDAIQLQFLSIAESLQESTKEPTKKRVSSEDAKTVLTIIEKARESLRNQGEMVPYA